MVQTNYIEERDELEIIFNNVEVPEVVTLKSGVSFEFSDQFLGSIIIPNFFSMIRLPPTNEVEYVCIDNNTLKLRIGEQKINVQLNLFELEKS